MKKLIISLTVGVSMLILVSSCRWIHETFYSVEGCAEWYLEELYDAASDNDVSDFRERYNQMREWEDELSVSDKKRSFKAGEKWGRNNPRKTAVIYDFAYKHGIGLY